MFRLEEKLILSNVLITGESNFDEKMSKKCSTDQSFLGKKNTTYKIGTLVDTAQLRNQVLIEEV